MAGIVRLILLLFLLQVRFLASYRHHWQPELPLTATRGAVCRYRTCVVMHAIAVYWPLSLMNYRPQI